MADGDPFLASAIIASDRLDAAVPVSTTRPPWATLRIVMGILSGVGFVVCFALSVGLAPALALHEALWAWAPIFVRTDASNVLVCSVAGVGALAAAWIAYVLRNNRRIHIAMLVAGPLVFAFFWTVHEWYSWEAAQLRGLAAFAVGMQAVGYFLLSFWGIVWSLAGIFGLLFIRLRPKDRAS